MNRAAQSLGRRAAGVPKSYTAAELAARTERLAGARAKRWAGHVKAEPAGVRWTFEVVVENGLRDQATVVVTVAKRHRLTGAAILKAMKLIPNERPWRIVSTSEPRNPHTGETEAEKQIRIGQAFGIIAKP